MSNPSGAPVSEMQQDVDNWAKKASTTLANPGRVTEPAGEAAWSSGFFECFSPIDTCLVTYFCPCITFGKTYHRLNKDAQLRGYSPVNASCLGWWASGCFGCFCIPSLLQKSDIAHRSQPKLSTNVVTDFLKSWCCHCCDLIQQDKEAAHLVEKEALINQEPQKQEGMYYNGNAQA